MAALAIWNFRSPVEADGRTGSRGNETRMAASGTSRILG
jgi:hypothetical protein